jgi:hypothetical protein
VITLRTWRDSVPGKEAVVSARRITLAVLILSALAALPTAAASAKGSAGLQPFYTFSVTFQGSGTYAQTYTDMEGQTSTINASFNWATPYENVLIPRVASPTKVGYPAFKHGAVATGTWQITSSNGDDSCQGSGTLGRVGVPGGGGVVTDGDLTLKRVSGGLQVLAGEGEGFSTAAGGGDGSSACHPKDFWHDIVLSAAHVGNDLTDGVQPLTGITKITPKDLKKASFVKSVGTIANELPDQDCGTGDGITCTQTYSWTGKVTFIKHKLKTAKKKS